MDFMSSSLQRYSRTSALNLQMKNKLYLESKTCFTGSSLVLLENGRQKKMSDLQVGDLVLTVNEKNILLFSAKLCDPNLGW